MQGGVMFVPHLALCRLVLQSGAEFLGTILLPTASEVTLRLPTCVLRSQWWIVQYEMKRSMSSTARSLRWTECWACDWKWRRSAWGAWKTGRPREQHGCYLRSWPPSSIPIAHSVVDYPQVHQFVRCLAPFSVFSSEIFEIYTLPMDFLNSKQ